MKQAIQKFGQDCEKFSQNCERWFCELLTKYTLLFCCFVVLVGAGAVALSYKDEQIRATVYAVGAILASFIALIQWASSRRVKRVELVDRLIEKITAIDPNSLAAALGEADSGKAALQEKDLTDKLAFLSYIAYLKKTDVLPDDEFNALRLDLVRILENGIVLDLIDNACSGNKDSKYIPYFYLLQYGAENCESTSANKYKKLLAIRGDIRPHEEHGAVAGSKLQQQLSNPVVNSEERREKKDVGEKKYSVQTGEVLDTASSGKTYDTHLDVLNGIFKLGYRAHMRAGATLLDGREVWFPKYYDSVSHPIQTGNCSDWINILNAKEGVILEYWPDGIEPNEKTWNKNYRYVFGKNLIPQNRQGRLTYRFLGIYKFVNREGDHFVYRRYSDKLLKADVERYLKADNF